MSGRLRVVANWYRYVADTKFIDTLNPRRLSGTKTGSASETRLLSTLADVNDALSSARSPRAGVQRALEILTPLYGVVCASVVLKDADTARLTVEASEGLTAKGRKARWQVGEGVTGRVVQTGRSVVIPRTDQEPMLLPHAGRRRTSRAFETTFICVPIPGDGHAIGALNVDLPFTEDRDYEHDLELFRVVATMFGQALRVTQLVEGERQHWIEENRHLKEELTERYDFTHIIGTSGPMRQVFEQIERVASTTTTVLIRGSREQAKSLLRTPSTTIPSAPRSPSSRSAAPHCPIPSSSPSSSATREEHSRAPPRANTGVSSWPMGARSFSTKSATSIPRPR